MKFLRMLVVAAVLALGLVVGAPRAEARKLKCSDVFYEMVNIERAWDAWSAAFYESGNQGPISMEHDQPDMWNALQELWQVLMNGYCEL